MYFYYHVFLLFCRSQWPSVLRRRSTAARLLRSWVGIPPGAWISVCCECCVLSGRGLCDGLITRPEESYRLWRVVVCDLEISWTRRSGPTGGLSRWGGFIVLCIFIFALYFNFCYVFYCYVYVFLLLRRLCSVYSVFIVPNGTLRLPWLRFFPAFPEL